MTISDPSGKTGKKSRDKHADELDDSIDALEDIISTQVDATGGDARTDIPVLDDIVEEDDVHRDVPEETGENPGTTGQLHKLDREELDDLLDQVEDKLATELDSLVDLLKDAIKDSIINELRMQLEPETSGDRKKPKQDKD